MERKNRLKGTSIIVENDLMEVEREIQNMIKEVIKERCKGKKVKI